MLPPSQHTHLCTPILKNLLTKIFYPDKTVDEPKEKKITKWKKKILKIKEKLKSKKLRGVLIRIYFD